MKLLAFLIIANVSDVSDLCVYSMYHCVCMSHFNSFWTPNNAILNVTSTCKDSTRLQQMHKLLVKNIDKHEHK